MKSICLLNVLTSSLICVISNAQEIKPYKQSKFKVGSFSLYYSINDERLPSATIEDFKKLSSNSELLEKDFSSYDLINERIKVEDKTYAGYVGLEFNNKEKNLFRRNSYLNIGINYSEGIDLRKYYSKSTDIHSNPSDPDTTYIESFSMKNNSKKLFLDLSLRYKIIPEKRFSFYTGIGLSVGLLYHNQTWISHSRDIYQYGVFQDSIPFNSTSQITYVNSNKMGFAIATYIPVGLDFRIGKKDSFLRMIHLFLEARPTAKLTFKPEIKPNVNALMNYGFGMKFTRE